MSSRYWSFITAIAGLAFVASALLLLVRDLSAVDSAYRHAATDAAIKYERDARANVKERCLTPAGFGEPDCTAKADEAAREGQRKEHDLAAQNITAWWTKVMGIAALIGMALSAVGVWLVKTTFDETRRANEIAKDSIHRQLRAYLTIEAAEIERTEWGKVYLIIHNSGSTPATDILIANDYFNAGSGQDGPRAEQTEVNDIGSQSRREHALDWYDHKSYMREEINKPTAITGTLSYKICVPNQQGIKEKIVIPFSLIPKERPSRPVEKLYLGPTNF